MKRRSDPRQLDLFRRADVVPFPTNRWAGPIRAVAAELLEMPEYADRDRHWKAVVGLIRDRLRAADLAPTEIDRQVMAFRVAVLCQARRMVITSIIHDQDGGAG